MGDAHAQRPEAGGGIKNRRRKAGRRRGRTDK